MVETWNEWGAARIPLELIDSIIVIIRRDQLVKALNEIQALVRKVRLRKYNRIDVN